MNICAVINFKYFVEGWIAFNLFMRHFKCRATRCQSNTYTSGVCRFQKTYGQGITKNLRFSVEFLFHMSRLICSLHRRYVGGIYQLSLKMFPAPSISFLHVKPPWQLPNHFHLLLQILGIHYLTIGLPFQFPTLPVFRRALEHHLFLLAYPDSSAKSGKIKPAQYITLRDIAPTFATAPPGNTMPPI